MPHPARNVRRVLIALLACALWLACFLAYTRHNDFPSQYHPDEPGKADQILGARRNYRHPQLLLEATQLYTWATATPRDRQAIAVAGRNVSAGFAAAAVVAFALCGFYFGGWLGFIAVAASVGACPPLLVHAHYFKEDAGLVLGIALVFLAAAHASRQIDVRGRRRATGWLGAACAVAASAKYVGLFTLLAALPVLIARRVPDREAPNPDAIELGPPVRPIQRAGRGAHIGAGTLGPFALAFLVVLLVINWRAFRNPGTIIKAFGNQVVDGVVEHKGLTMNKPTAYFVRATWEDTGWHTLLLATIAGAWVAYRSVRPQPTPTPERSDGQGPPTGAIAYPTSSASPVPWPQMIVVFPAAYLGLISFSSAPNHRHVLPVVVMLHFLAAMTGVWITATLSGQGSPWLRVPNAVPGSNDPLKRAGRQDQLDVLGAIRMVPCIAFVLLTMLTQWPTCRALLAQFHDDGRDRLRVWAKTELPSDARVLQDAAAQLDPGPRIVTRSFAPEFGDFDALRRDGVTHVAVCDLAFGRYFDPHVHPTPGFRAEHERRRAWYERLFREGYLVWGSDPAPPLHANTNPSIRVYRVRR